MNTQETKSTPAYRDHPLRRVQTLLQPASESMLRTMYRSGLLSDTRIARVFDAGIALHADDVTFSNLQMTVSATDKILSEGPKSTHVTRWLVGWSLDGFDGAIARLRGEAGPDGAVKDVVLDRLGEIYAAKRIGEVVSSVTGQPYTRIPDLMAAMQLSTLTKAACEMCGTPTSEGGIGGMISRRRILLDTIIHAAKLRTVKQQDKRTHVLSAISENVETIIRESHQRSKERAATMKPSHTVEILYPGSSAAIEARKYAALVLVNNKNGLDLVQRLRELSPDTVFPTIKDLSNYPYISATLADTKPLIDQAIALTGLK